MITSPRRSAAQPSRHPPFRVHSASGSIDRACISGLDPGRLPPPGTAAISTRSTTGRRDDPGSPIQGRGSLTSHDQSRSPCGDLRPGLRGTTGQGGHDRQPARGGHAARSPATPWNATPNCASWTTATAGTSWSARASSDSGTRPPPGPSTASTSSTRIDSHASMHIRF